MSRSRSWLAVTALLGVAGVLAWRWLAGMERSARERADPQASVTASGPVPAELQAAAALPGEPGAASREPRTEVAPAEVAAGGEATWIVTLVAQETGARLPGVELALHQPTGAWHSSGGRASSGRPGDVLRTDAQGRAEFVVEAGQAYTLEVNPSGNAEVERKQVTVLTLAPGERRESEVRLRVEPELVWFGLLVDGQTGAPLAGARVVRGTGNPFRGPFTGQTVESAADGLVELRYASWSASWVRVELPGYAAAYAVLTGWHEIPATAMRVRLLRAAALELTVTDAAGAPRADLRVLVSYEPYDLVQAVSFAGFGFEAEPIAGDTDAGGRCVLESLPPEVPLTVEAFAGEHLLRRAERGLQLVAGERRELRWTVGDRCLLAGRTLEEDATPAASVLIWLLADDGVLILKHRKDRVLAETRSDAEGRFTFEVAAGAWLVGPAPDQGISPVVSRLEVAPGQTSAELTLTCWSGRFLSGTVVDPDGRAVQEGFVNAMGEELSDAATFRDGSFSIGPLPPGWYELVAGDLGRNGLTDSEPHRFDAGTDGIELVLRRGAGLRLHVLDSRGNPAFDYMVWVLPEPGSEGGLVGEVSAGMAEFDSLLPGVFSVSAATAGEFALARGVVLTAGTDQLEVELRLEPAARLRVDFPTRTEAGTNAEVRLDGCPIALVFPEHPATALAPGEYEVVLSRYRDSKPEELQRQRVRVVAGDETRVVFDLQR